MDAVYILGSGSLAGNKEILYSIRSLENCMLDLEDVYIVGDDPGFLPGAIHIPANDLTAEKWKNAYLKVKTACALPELSSEFLLMNDDFFLLDSFLGKDWPFYSLKGSNGGSCGVHSFHVHCPIRIEKELYSKMPFSLDQKACRSPRTFYCNFYRLSPTASDDFILRAAKDCKPFASQIAGRPCFSVGDSAMLYPPFLSWLGELYAQPSRFE